MVEARTYGEMNAQSCMLEQTAAAAALRGRARSGKSLWVYLRKSFQVGLDVIDPFIGVMSLVPIKVERNKQGRVAIRPEDIARIYQAALDNKDRPMADIIALGAYTRARINELACLKATDNTGAQSFKITDAKTRAGIREIPIHPAIEALVVRLKQGFEFRILNPVRVGELSAAVVN